MVYSAVAVLTTLFGTIWVDVVLGASFLGLYFWRLARQIRRFAGGQAHGE